MFAKKKLEMFEDQHGLHFSFNWINPATYFLAFFTLFWDTFLLFWYATAIAIGAPILYFLVPILHLLFGIVMTYSVVTSLFNKTKIDLIGDKLTVQHGPIPGLRVDKEIDIKDIQQFYVKELKDHKKNRKTYNFGLYVILNDGSKLDLTNGVNMKSDYALIVEQKLEKYLGIKDEKVSDAFRKSNRKIKIEKIEMDDTPLDLEELKKNQPDPEIDHRENWTDEDLV